MNTEELVKTLTLPCAVSGCENNLYDVISDIISSLGKAEIDNMNNISCTFGSGDYHIMLEAHIDEIGFVVTSITDKGFIKFSPVGGIDRRLLPANEVVIWGKEAVNGIISTIPPHLKKGDKTDGNYNISEMAIDIGMSREEAEKIISMGDRITFLHSYDKLLGSRVSSNCLDDRAGAASIILAAQKVKGLPVKVTLQFSAQEEVGTRGAVVGAYGKDIDEAIAVDVSFGFSHGCKKDDCGELGKGAMIGISPTLDRNISDMFIKCAEANKINYQLEIMNGRTGTDADVITLTQSGIKCGLLSIPLKYMHTPVEVVDLKDIESVADIIAQYISEKAGVCNA
ncbi:MAG: M42 family peptidase [Eubacterium sp.]